VNAGRKIRDFVARSKVLFTAMVIAVAFTPAAHAQGQPAPGRDGTGSIQIRVLCVDIVPDETRMSLLQKDKVVHEIDLTRAMVSDSLGFARDEIALARRAVAEDHDPEAVIRISLPDEGTRFVLVLFPKSEADQPLHYEHVLVRTDDLKFNTSDLLMMNRTEVSIGGTVGSQEISLAPQEMHVVTPDPLQGEWMYDVRFHQLRDGNPQLFSEARWPRAKSARVYLFFFYDRERQTINYVSFREYAPFP